MRHVFVLLMFLAAAVVIGCGQSEAPPPAAPVTPDDPYRLPEKRTVTLPTGITMAYFEMGAAAGEPLLFVHGLTDSGRSFHPTMVHLARLRPDLRLVAIDLRGHGASSMPEAPGCRTVPEGCFRPQDFAADAVAFLDHLGIERVTLVGHSLGSAVCQMVALDAPARVERVVLVSTWPGGTLPSEARDFLLTGLIEGPWRTAVEAQGRTFPDDAWELTPLDADPGAQAWLAENWVTEPLADPALLAAIAPETARVRIGTWIGATRAAFTFDNRERLRELAVPAFVAWGIQDTLTHKPSQDRLLEALDAAVAAGTTRYVWKQYGERPPAADAPPDDVAHNLPWGIPAQLARDIAAYLETGEPTADHVFGAPGGGITVRPGEALLIRRP